MTGGARGFPQAWVFLLFLLLGMGLGGCGVSKTPLKNGRVHRLPELERPTKEIKEEGTLILKSEDLKLTLESQEWKLNILKQDRGGERYQRFQKKFPLPFQFNGWISLDQVENLNRSCVQDLMKEPLFILIDDHGGEILLTPGERVVLSFEKLYALQAEYFNDSLCQGIHIRFGIHYGLHD